VGATRPHITVVGLGPAGTDYMADNVSALMAGADRAYVRTRRHPAASGFHGAESFDELYDEADTFEQVYAEVVERLVQAATEEPRRSVVYAVPGSPLIAERTVEILRDDLRVDITVIPGLSFLDLAWERLGLDPLSAGVHLVDAAQFARTAAGERGPFLVAQCWSPTLLSEMKLSIELDDGEPTPTVVLLHHLGLPDERVEHVDWWELDRTLQPDHLTSVYIPALPVAAVEREMARLEELVRTLRAQCPWDRAQTHGTLMPHLVEESYEVLDALREMDTAEQSAGTAASHLQEELGDLLFQIVFHARLAQEEGLFTLADVARGVHDKLVHRHPHVFGEVDADTAEQVVTNWEAIKKEEKGRASVTEGIPTSLPALLLSTKLQRKAISVGLVDPVLTADGASLSERVGRLALGTRHETLQSADAALDVDAGDDEAAVGELLFAVANLSRRLGIDPEQALRTRALRFRDSIRIEEAGGPPSDDVTPR
jgi:tetrapyrrole methylase family protein / MazG family protein